jgi:hypothetical protein
VNQKQAESEAVNILRSLLDYKPSGDEQILSWDIKMVAGSLLRVSTCACFGCTMRRQGCAEEFDQCEELVGEHARNIHELRRSLMEVKK